MSKKKVYIAAHDRWAARHVARLVFDAGHELSCGWLADPTMLESDTLPDWQKRAEAIRDIEDVRASDVLILLADPEGRGGGKFVEAGVALALDKPVIVVGKRENVLLYHPHIDFACSPEEAVRLL